MGESQLDVTPLRLLFDHVLAFACDFGQRNRFLQQLPLAGLDHCQIEYLVYQPQQIPSRLGNLLQPESLLGRWRR